MRSLFCWALALSVGYGVRGQRYIPLLRSYPATDRHIQYMGRVESGDWAGSGGRVERASGAVSGGGDTDSGAVRFWSPGVVVRMKVRGQCMILLRDQVPNDKTHNYIEIIIDDLRMYRVKLEQPMDSLVVRANGGVDLNGRSIAYGDDLPAASEHVITLCKDTESGIGWLEITGVKTERLVRPPALPKRKIEFIGNSITAGTGMDESEIPCGKGEWYDQHNAWMSYGAQTARLLEAQWHLTAVAGIGLVHSCCGMDILMPQVFDKMDLRDNTGAWDFQQYVPDIVTLCLGQNDGIQDSAIFCGAYMRFLGDIRRQYPMTQIVCLTSPMGNKALTGVQKRYLGAVVAAMRASGDRRVSSYFFSKQYSRGCGGHPDLGEHGLIAQELTAYLRRLMKW